MKYSIYIQFVLISTIIHILSQIKKSQAIECTNLNQRKFEQQTFCFRDCHPLNSTLRSPTVRVYTHEQFESSCKNFHGYSNDGSPFQPTFLNSNVKKYSQSLNRPLHGKASTIHVFVFDFHLISGDVFIDFKTLNLNHLQSLNTTNNGNHSSLVLNLVTRQFVTFRIFNLPSNKSEYLTDIKILLSGDSSLDLIEKKSDLKIDVFHSPVYDKSPNRTEWMAYLNGMFASKNNYYFESYMEYLSVFCHISHIRIDLNSMLAFGISDYKSVRLEESFVESLDKIVNFESQFSEYYLPKICSINYGAMPNHDFHKNEHDFNSEIYVFEIEQNLLNDGEEEQIDDTFYLRMFLKECDINQEYVLILYVTHDRKVNKLKKLILDDSNCQIRVYVR